MTKHQIPSSIKKNRLLAALPKAEYQQLLPDLEEISLEFKQPLYEVNKPISHVWFPNYGVVSLIAPTEDDTFIEVANIGNEGMVGLPLFLGVNTTTVKAFAQVPGTALRMTADAFKNVLKLQKSLHMLLQRYTHVLMNQIAQSAACNRTHSLEQRCARWLLLTHDRVMDNEFVLTQEFLAQMLGVQRGGVNSVASKLQKAKLIKYSRGRMYVLDRIGLEATSCPCYALVQQEYEKILGY